MNKTFGFGGSRSGPRGNRRNAKKKGDTETLATIDENDYSSTFHTGQEWPALQHDVLDHSAESLQQRESGAPGGRSLLAGIRHFQLAGFERQSSASFVREQQNRPAWDTLGLLSTTKPQHDLAAEDWSSTTHW
jgi:hypothetical protein